MQWQSANMTLSPPAWVLAVLLAWGNSCVQYGPNILAEVSSLELVPASVQLSHDSLSVDVHGAEPIRMLLTEDTISSTSVSGRSHEAKL